MLRFQSFAVLFFFKIRLAESIIFFVFTLKPKPNVIYAMLCLSKKRQKLLYNLLCDNIFIKLIAIEVDIKCIRCFIADVWLLR